jgi:hypothetical protein
MPLVSQHLHVHRIPASRVVTIARNAPLIKAGWRHTIIISEKEKAKFFDEAVVSRRTD